MVPVGGGRLSAKVGVGWWWRGEERERGVGGGIYTLPDSRVITSAEPEALVIAAGELK